MRDLLLQQQYFECQNIKIIEKDTFLYPLLFWPTPHVLPEVGPSVHFSLTAKLNFQSVRVMLSL